MSTYTAVVGADLAAEIPTWTDLLANGVEIEDLGDGRIRFGEDAMRWFRGYTKDENGCITDAGENHPVQIWIGGIGYPITVER